VRVLVRIAKRLTNESDSAQPHPDLPVLILPDLLHHRPIGRADARRTGDPRHGRRRLPRGLRTGRPRRDWPWGWL